MLALAAGCVTGAGGETSGAFSFGPGPDVSDDTTGAFGSSSDTTNDPGMNTDGADEAADATTTGTDGLDATDDESSDDAADSSDTGIEEPSPLAPRRVIQGHTFLDIDDAGDGNIKFLYESYCDVVVNDGTCAVLNACDIACPSEVATAAYDNMGVFLGCMDDLFGRDSYDGNGAELRAVIETSTIFGPFWNRNEAMFEATAFNDYTGHPATSLDTVLHEFTHGMILHTSSLAHDGSESSALNEGLADVFASICTWWSLPPGSVGDAVWQISEDVIDNPNDLSDPASVPGISDHYSDGAHGSLAKGIVGLAFHLLSEGGTHPRPTDHPGGPVVVGIGIASAAQIFYRANELLAPNATHADMRHATRLAAQELYPESPGLLSSIDQAWDAVGVPNP